eukprot:4411190-Pyramimonas_sp.AAC.1
MPGDGSGWSPGDRARTRLFRRLSPRAVDLHRERDARREVRAWVVARAARLDRAHPSLPPAVLRDSYVRPGVIGILKARMPSDRAPFFFSIEPFQPGTSSPAVPEWIASREEF